jgi:carboxypeptidase C (cathepsin A)
MNWLVFDIAAFILYLSSSSPSHISIINLYITMKVIKSSLLSLLLLALLLTASQALLTSKMAKNRFSKAAKGQPLRSSDNGPVITTSCNRLDFSKTYNYSGIVASGYLTVGKGNSALAYTFYGQKDVRTESQLRNYPTILWLNGGPGSSSQTGNLQEIGPLQLIRQFDVIIRQNNYTWANNYNLLFVDQPVGTGLSYADTSASNPFAKSMDGTALLT